MESKFAFHKVLAGGKVTEKERRKTEETASAALNIQSCLAQVKISHHSHHKIDQILRDTNTENKVKPSPNR